MALINTSELEIVDVLAEGEIEGFATPHKDGLTNAGHALAVGLKDFFLDDTPVVRGNATVLAGTYEQIDNNGAITGTYLADEEDIIVTVTSASAHGFEVDDTVDLTFTNGTNSGDPDDGEYLVDDVTSDTVFTCINTSGEIGAGSNTSTSGNVSINVPADVIKITTTTAHGFAEGDFVFLAIGSGTAETGTVKVSDVVSSTEFKAEATNDQATSGAVGVIKREDVNFDTPEVTLMTGTTDQEAILGFDTVESETAVNVDVLKRTPITRSIVDPSVDFVRLRFQTPALSFSNDDGSVSGSAFKMKVVTIDADGTEEVELQRKIKGKALNPYQFDFEIDLRQKKFPVDIKVIRITKDNNNARRQNKFQWVSFTAIKDTRLRYPHAAYAAVRISAKEFQRPPRRGYRIRGRKISIPSNATVDLATGALIYSGTWDGTFNATKQWTSDPAWVLWDLLTDYRAGLGNHLNTSQLDKFAFFAASKYCSALDTFTVDGRSGTTNDYDPVTGKHGLPTGLKDENGNVTYEPRFSCNIALQNQREAFKVIADLSSIFRAMPFLAAGSMTVSQDSPKDPSYLFTLANVLEGGFEYSTSSQKTRPSVVLVSYQSLETRREEFEQVEDPDMIARRGLVTEEVTAVGCTSQSQARRVGEWFLYTNSNEYEVCSFTTSIDSGAVVRPGDVIQISDPVRSGGRFAGRISSATSTVVTVDNADELPDSGGTLSVILPDGRVEAKSVSSRTNLAITVSSAFSETPAANSVWLWETANISPTTWRVLSIAETEPATYEVTALSHNSSKYDHIEREQELQVKDVTLLDEPPGTPQNLSITEDLYAYQNVVLSKISLSWESVEKAASYVIVYSKDDGNDTEIEFAGNSGEILDTSPGVYDIEVYAVAGSALRSNVPAVAEFTAQGKLNKPADVTGFSASVDPNNGVVLNWNAVPDLDLQGYEIWEDAPGFELQQSAGTKVGVFFTTEAKINKIPAGTQTKEWYIKALDTSGKYSESVASAGISIGQLPAPQDIETSFEGANLKILWSDVNPGEGTSQLATDYYDIRSGSNTTTAADFETLKTLGHVYTTGFTTAVTFSNNSTKFYIRAVDIKGNPGTVSTVGPINITHPKAPATLVATVVDNNVKLSWTEENPPADLPISTYQIRKGDTFDSASIIGDKKGLFTTIVETIAGNFVYHVAGVDSAGNIGTPKSVQVGVKAPPNFTVFADINSDFTSATLSNAVLSDGAVYAMVNTTETWQQHFNTNNSFATLQAAKDAVGSPDLYLLPSLTSGSYTEEFDLGSVVTGTATFLRTDEDLRGTTTVTPTISFKESSSDSYTDHAGVEVKFATNFRFVKIKYDYTGTSNDDIVKMTGLSLKVDTKIKTEQGSGTGAASDSAGTQVNLSQTFVNIDSVNVTPTGTSAVLAVVDDVQVGSFKVLLFNLSGARVSGDFTFVVSGS